MTYEDTLLVRQELAPLIEPEKDDAKALRFDALMYGIELAYLAGKKYSRGSNELFKKASAIANVSNIPEIMMQADLLDKILHTDYVESDDLNEGLEVSIVDKVAVGLAVLGNEHIKVAHQLTALPAGDLMHGIHAVGQILALGKAISKELDKTIIA